MASALGGEFYSLSSKYWQPFFRVLFKYIIYSVYTIHDCQVHPRCSVAGQHKEGGVSSGEVKTFLENIILIVSISVIIKITIAMSFPPKNIVILRYNPNIEIRKGSRPPLNPDHVSVDTFSDDY